MPPPLLLLIAGTVPVILVSVSVRPPAAAATFLMPEILVSDVVAIVPSPVLRRLSVSILVPAAGLVPVPKLPRKPKLPGVNEPAVGVLVTVMSVSWP